MIQEIIALIIVAAAVTYSLRNIYTFFNKTSKGKMCSCKSCPSNDLLKEIKKAQKHKINLN